MYPSLGAVAVEIELQRKLKGTDVAVFNVSVVLPVGQLNEEPAGAVDKVEADTVSSIMSADPSICDTGPQVPEVYLIKLEGAAFIISGVSLKDRELPSVPVTPLKVYEGLANWLFCNL